MKTAEEIVERTKALVIEDMAVDSYLVVPDATFRSLGLDSLDDVELLIAVEKANVWMGVSVEDQRRADERIPILLDTPAAVRWISAEPLLGPVVLERLGQHWLGAASQRAGMNDGLDWVVVGGETGRGHRPMEIEWLESIVAQCRKASVPVFVKQASGNRPGKQGRIPDELWALKEFPA